MYHAPGGATFRSRMRRCTLAKLAIASSVLAAGCGQILGFDALNPPDGGGASRDATVDAQGGRETSVDGREGDSHSAQRDSGEHDSGEHDSGERDSGAPDSGDHDAAHDAGAPDAHHDSGRDALPEGRCQGTTDCKPGICEDAPNCQDGGYCTFAPVHAGSGACGDSALCGWDGGCVPNCTEHDNECAPVPCQGPGTCTTFHICRYLPLDSGTQCDGGTCDTHGICVP